MVTQTKPVLPDFTRWQWSSLAEREWWSVLFREASNAYLDLERLSVVEGIRPAAWQFIEFHEIPYWTQWAQKHDLIMIPMHLSYQSGNYSSRSGNSGQPNSVRVVFTRMENYKDIFPFEEDSKIGKYLGIPKCCQQHFKNTWGAGQVDSTWEQIAGTLQVLPHTSSMLRYMGIRFVPHMPCSFDCVESEKLGQAFYDLGVKHGYLEQMLLVKEVLRWPVVATRLFGIAELEFPCLKITTRSDWTPTLEKFQTAGDYTKPSASHWTDNGFNSHRGMRDVHTTLLHTLKENLHKNAYVLDLGCGNGMLLRRLKLHRPDIAIGGIDINDKAVKSIPFGSGSWHTGQIQSLTWAQTKRFPDAILMNPARLLEMTPEESLTTRMTLANVPQQFYYCYEDWSKKGGLEQLIRDTQLEETPSPWVEKIQMLTKMPQLSVAMNTTK